MTFRLRLRLRRKTIAKKQTNTKDFITPERRDESADVVMVGGFGGGAGTVTITNLSADPVTTTVIDTI